MKPSKLSKLFLQSAIVQGALLLAVTFVLFVYGSIAVIPTPAMVIALGSAGTWIMVGYVLYIAMIIALAVTGLLYDYIEFRLGKKLDRISEKLGFVQLEFMNGGIIGATWLLMYGGYLGGVGLLPVEVGGLGLSQLQVHEQILGAFPVPIMVFCIITMIGVLAGGVAFIRMLRKK